MIIRFKFHFPICSEEFLGRTHYITLDALLDGFDDASYLRLEIKKGKLNSRFEDL
jgi:hypothetical protein